MPQTKPISWFLISLTMFTLFTLTMTKMYYMIKIKKTHKKKMTNMLMNMKW